MANLDRLVVPLDLDAARERWTNEPLRAHVAHNGNVYIEDRAASLRTGWVTYRDEPACRVDMETGAVIPDGLEHLRIREFPAWDEAMGRSRVERPDEEGE